MSIYKCILIIKNKILWNNEIFDGYFSNALTRNSFIFLFVFIAFVNLNLLIWDYKVNHSLIGLQSDSLRRLQLRVWNVLKVDSDAVL